jgi:hypothetical protein
MPPKKLTAMAQIRAQKAKLDREKKDEIAQKVAKPKVPTTDRKAQQIVEYEQTNRVFFKRLISVEDDKLKETMIAFSQDRGSWGWQRKIDIENIINTIPQKLYKDLATRYIEQPKILAEYWAYYVTRPQVRVAIDEKRYDDSIFEDDELFAVEDKPAIVPPKKIVKQLKPGERKVIEVDEMGADGKFIGKIIEQKIEPKIKKPLTLPKRVTITPYDGCFKDQRDVPWLKNIDFTIITPALGDSLHEISDYIQKDISYPFKGLKWYRVKKTFHNLMCRSFRTRDEESNSVVATINGKKVRMQIAYVTKDKDFIIQDEDIFKLEKEYIKNLKMYPHDKVSLFLKSKIDESTQKFAKDRLAEILSFVAPEVEEYKDPNGQYITRAVEKMMENSVINRDLLTRIAEIGVYLKDNNGIFFKRIKQEYYIPEILVTLTREEKLPEVFDDPTEKNIYQINNIIDNQVNNFVQTLADSIYQKNNATERVPMRPYAQLPQYKVNKWKSACDEDLEGVPDEHIVYYKEDGKVYCLLISNIYEQLNSEGGIAINPTTKKPLDEDFLERFRQLYDSKFNRTDIDLAEPDMIESILPEKPKTPTPIRQYAPGLLDMIKSNILGCEKEIKNDTLGEGERCKSLEGEGEEIKEEEEDEDELKPRNSKEIAELFDSDSDVSKDIDVDDDDEEEELYDKAKVSKEIIALRSSADKTATLPKAGVIITFKESEPNARYKVYDVDDKHTIDMFNSLDIYKVGEKWYRKGTEDDASAHSPGTPIIIEDSACQYCKKKINKKKCLKSKIYVKKQFHTVCFCSFKCFEEHNVWPKKRNIDKKGGKNVGKKGGRNGSKERNSKK